MTELDRGREAALKVQPFRLPPEEIKRLEEYFTCRCPEPDPPGWAHLVPIDCEALRKGETLDEWRERRGMGDYYRSFLKDDE